MISPLGQTVLEDLRYLERSWKADELIPQDTLRRDSVVLRRLVVDGGLGDVSRYWRELGNRSQIKVTGVDLASHIAALEADRIHFASAGGATHNNMTISATLRYDGTQDAMERYNRAKAIRPRTSTLNTYLQATCLRIDGVAVSRHSVVQFVANRLGGAHHDDDRGHQKHPHVAKQFAALDQIVDVHMSEQQAVYFELLAVGQDLLRSAQVQQMMATTIR